MDEESKKDTAEIDSYIAGMICKQTDNGVPTNASANASSTNANVDPGGTLLKAITKHVKNVNPNEWQSPAVQTSTLVTKRSNRNMSKSKGWTLQSSLLMLWMDENSNQQSNKNC